MRSTAVIAGFGALAMLAACSQPAPPKPAEPAKPAAPAIPAEIQGVAESVLGTGAEVLVFGDLARTGTQQVLAINRLPKTPTGAAPGTLLTRAVIAENNGGKWKEVFRCDEHLKNPNGFLGGTPITPITGWRLQQEQSPEKGLVMYFTPLEMAGESHVPTVGVRWNPKVKRYQSLDRSFEQFLTEVPTLERINSRLK